MRSLLLAVPQRGFKWFVNEIRDAFDTDQGCPPGDRLAIQACVVILLVAIFVSIGGDALAAGAKHRQFKRRARVSRIAHDFQGTPYVWGGSSESGADCSGLSLAVYRRAFGYNLPHSAAAQASLSARAGWRSVWSVKNLKRGDLVFWKNTYKPGVSHAGVYVGGGYAVMAHGFGSNANRTYIRSSYYMSHWAKGVRPPKLQLHPWR